MVRQGMLRHLVKPSEFDLRTNLAGSNLKNNEEQIVACNIIAISKTTYDMWLSFTFEDYRSLCSRQVSPGEQDVLDQMVAEKLLSKTGDMYRINDAFIALLWPYITDAD